MSIWRQFRAIHGRAQQAVGTLAERAKIARLHVVQNHAAGGELDVDVEFGLQQPHDPFDAPREKRVVRTEIIQRAKQPGKRDQLFISVTPREGLVSYHGKPSDVLLESTKIARHLSGYDQYGGREGRALDVVACEIVLQRGIERCECAAIAMMRFGETFPEPCIRVRSGHRLLAAAGGHGSSLTGRLKAAERDGRSAILLISGCVVVCRTFPQVARPFHGRAGNADGYFPEASAAALTVHLWPNPEVSLRP